MSALLWYTWSGWVSDWAKYGTGVFGSVMVLVWEKGREDVFRGVDGGFKVKR